MTNKQNLMLVEENLLKQAISMFEYRPVIIKPTGGGILRQIKESQPDIKAALAACESTVVPGLLGRERSQAYILIADRLIEAELFDHALLFYHKAVLADPDNLTTWMKQGELYLDQEQFIAALACFQKISTLAAKVQTAMILNILGWHDQALMYLNSLSPTTSEQGMISQAKAECFEATGDYHNALLELKKILNEDSDPEFWYKYIQLSHKAGRDDELKRTLPHILPLWNFDSIQKNLISRYFKKEKDQDWLKKTLPKDGIYCMSKEEANRFLLASLISYLEKPERINTRINAFLLRREATLETLWQVIAGTDLTAWKSYPPEHRLHPNANRHEMVHRMAVFLVKYEGDARGLWSGVTRGEVLIRLEDIGFQDTVNDFIIRTISESREIPVKLDKKWNDDRHLNRITARLILGEDTLSDHPDVVYAIHEHFRNVDDFLHRIGKKYCLLKEYSCSICGMKSVCTKYQNDNREENEAGWRWVTEDEEEQDTYYFTEGEEVNLAGTSVHGTVTKTMQESQEIFINLKNIEDYPAEVESFYALINEHPLVRNLNG